MVLPTITRMIKKRLANSSRFLIGAYPTNMLICLSLIIALVSTSCGVSDPEDENGTIGTGIILKGTVNHKLLAQGTRVDVISSDGQRSDIPINSASEFSTTSLAGTGPWMLRVQVSADRELFGMAYGDGTRNINAFSDVSLRRWFAQNSLRIDDYFDSAQSAIQLPDSTEYDAAVSSIVQLVELALMSYSVSGDDIISTNYTANNQGIDAFLNQNTVVIENDLITFQLTNPENDIKTETTTAIELADDSIDNGTAPTAPGSVRSLSDGMDDIVLIWEPSSDDTGVLGYEVYRDNVLLGTTPYPQFIDTDIIDGRNYSYVVVAFDTGGNSSEPSSAVAANATQTTGTTPSAPIQLSKISASSSTIRLSWLAPDAADVASYNVYRGVQDTTSTLYTLLQRVSVPRATDTAVAINETYCYQVEAVTASGLTSSRSEALCIQATNSGTTGDTTAGSNALPDSRWIVPDVSTLDCSSVLSTQDISLGLTTITDGCYSVPQTLVVRDGATLQLGEGVTFKFGETASLYVEGTLTALGTVNNPVVFTGMVSVSGSWGGVEFAGTRNPANYLRGTVIEYGGGADVRAAVSAVVSGLFGAPRFRMDDTLVRYTQGSALFFSVINTRVDSFQGNLIYANDRIGSSIAGTVNTLAGSSQFIDNGVQELFVNPTFFEGIDIVIPNLGITILWGGITIESGSLTILPGADIKISAGGLVDVDGPVTIVGDAERPITLRGRQTGTQGTWDGLRLQGAGNKILDYVNISYGGAIGQETGALEIDCTGSNRFLMQIDNTNITDSASWGIFVKGDRCTKSIGDTVTYWNNALGDSNMP